MKRWVSKTSLVRYLITGETRNPHEPKTTGTAIHERIETHAWRDEGSDIRLNVWDFGGQEIMHGTHRFFLSPRSLYLLVLEARREDDGSVFSWLKTIGNRGGDSPVIVVINKCDDGTHNLRLDQTALRRNYPNIVDVLSASCEPNEFAHESIGRLHRAIADTISSRLEHVRNPIPAPWLRVKEEVASLAREKSLLEFRKFLELCTEGDSPAERIDDPDEQRALLRLLHDLGVVVAHGLERDAPAALREVTLLDPNWLTGAIYALLTSRDVLNQGGEFSRHQLQEWLDPDRYPPQRHEYILDMMQAADLGLCFRLPTERSTERYLLPEALPANEPDYDNWPPGSLRFRYEYDYLPPGMIPRFIVQAHRHLTDKPTRWRTGVVLEVDRCRVLVKGDRERRRIDVSVDGPPKRQRSALAVVRDHLDVVHALNPEAGPHARVPLPDDPDKSVSYDDLLAWETREGSHYAFYPEGSSRKYTVAELLDGIRDAPRRSDDPGPRNENSAIEDIWQPAASMGLGLFMLVSIVAVALLFLGVDKAAGAEIAAAATTVALIVVLAVAAFMLRATGQLSQENLLKLLSDLLKHIKPGQEHE